MKRSIFYSLMCLTALILVQCEKTPDIPEGYVDLGLTSGNYWKAENEEGFISYDIAIREFGDQLPSGDSWTELYEECDWTFAVVDGKVIATIKGPNGNSIQMPLEGFTNCSGEFQERFSSQGRYWSSSTSSLSYGYCFIFDGTGSGGLYPMEMCDGMSIRLIHKK